MFYSIFAVLIAAVAAYFAAPYIRKIIHGLMKSGKSDDATEREIRMLLDEGEEDGTIEEAEREMINNIFEFNNKTAVEIATHRKDLVALPKDAPREEIVRTVVREGYSRLPVYEENIDNIVGVLHIKDMLNYILDPKDEAFDLTRIMRKPYFVPLSKKTDELFEEMQKNKVHMVVVVDEYGGTEGIVTMEDLIEEIMGSILDEYDDDESPEIEEIADKTYLVNGKTDLETVAEFFNAKLPIEDYETVGGFIIGELGRIPLRDEQPELELEGLIFKVYKMAENRIESAVISKIKMDLKHE